MPPTYSGSASRTVTGTPCLLSTYAAVRPAGPAPMMPTRGLGSDPNGTGFVPMGSDPTSPLGGKIASSTPDLHRALERPDLAVAPGAVASGVCGRVAELVAAPQVLCASG